MTHVASEHFFKGFFMAEAKERIERCLDNLPDPKEIRQRIAENIKERQILRQLLRASEQRITLSNSKREAVR
jgi:hypothetical protein